MRKGQPVRAVRQDSMCRVRMLARAPGSGAARYRDEQKSAVGQPVPAEGKEGNDSVGWRADRGFVGCDMRSCLLRLTRFSLVQKNVRHRAEDPGALDVEDGVPPPRAAPPLLRRVVLSCALNALP